MNYRSFLTILALALVVGACSGAANESSPASSPPATPAVGSDGEQVFTLEVTGAGFVPAKLLADSGKPIKLVVTRKTEKTCATEIVIKEYGINEKLPLNQAVEVVFTPAKPGKLRFACAMDMIAGEIELR